MLSFEQARKRLFELPLERQITSVETERAVGRVLADDQPVAEDLPRFTQSAMDGYAVRSEDLTEASKESPVTLTVRGTVGAGHDPGTPVDAGDAARIFTGAPLPEGADAVVIQENVEANGETASFHKPAEPGDNVRDRGEEINRGSTLLEKGHRIGPASVGLLLSQGLTTVEVFEPPRTLILSTGDELVDPSEDPGPAAIRDTNGPSLRSLLDALGVPGRTWRVGDDRDALRRSLEGALADFDVLFVCGGVSVGERDYVREELATLGVEQIFWKVNQKPGKPVYVGRRENTFVLGLPGNPVSCLVSFYLYGYPFLRKCMGLPRELWDLPRSPTRLRRSFTTKTDRTEFVRAATHPGDEGVVSRVLEHQGSHMLSGLARANSLVRLPAEEETVSIDTPCTAYFLPRLASPVGGQSR